MVRYPINKNRICCVCGDKENRESTPYELQFKVLSKWIRHYVNGIWDGKHICSRCYSRNYNHKRSEILNKVRI